MSAYVTALIASIQALDPVTSFAVLFGSSVLACVSIVVTTTPFNFAFGAQFGVLVGGVGMCLACTLGSMINFFLGRFVFSAWARRKMADSPTLAALEAALAEQAASIIFLARLSPVFPMALLGYCIGATSVPLTTYAASTFGGLLPGCVLYAWIGAAATGGGGWSSVISVSISVLSTIVITVRAKQLVDEALKKSKPKAAQ